MLSLRSIVSHELYSYHYRFGGGIGNKCLSWMRPGMLINNLCAPLISLLWTNVAESLTRCHYVFCFSSWHRLMNVRFFSDEVLRLSSKLFSLPQLYWRFSVTNSQIKDPIYHIHNYNSLRWLTLWPLVRRKYAHCRKMKTKCVQLMQVFVEHFQMKLMITVSSPANPFTKLSFYNQWRIGPQHKNIAKPTSQSIIAIMLLLLLLLTKLYLTLWLNCNTRLLLSQDFWTKMPWLPFHLPGSYTSGWTPFLPTSEWILYYDFRKPGLITTSILMS